MVVSIGPLSARQPLVVRVGQIRRNAVYDRLSASAHDDFKRRNTSDSSPTKGMEESVWVYGETESNYMEHILGYDSIGIIWK